MDKKRLKIVFLSKFQKDTSRGVETFVIELSKRLSKYHEITILSGKDASSFFKILKGDYQIVFAMNGRFQAVKASVGRFFGKYKLIITGQSGVGKDDIFNVAIVKPDIFVPITHFASEMHVEEWRLPTWKKINSFFRKAKTWSWGSKVIVIPNGVDLETFSPKGRKERLDLERPIILSVGALEWYKHHERSIMAMSLMEKGSLLIIGKGSLENELNKKGRELLGDKRFKIMQVSFSEIDVFYRSADLFVLPSWEREAFGIVYLEALATNLPVVAPDDLPRREIVGSGGILVDTKDPKEYMLAIKKALDTNWGNRPRKQAEKFSWDKIANQYEELFTEIIK